MRIRLISAVLASVLAVAALAGCKASAPGTAADKNTSSTENPVKLKFYKAGLSGSEHDYWVDVLDRYGREHNVEFEFVEAQWGEEIETKLSTTFASGISVDIVGQAIVQMPIRVSKNQVIPLDEYVQHWDGLEDMNENILNSAVYNEQLYAIPYYPEVMLWAYRKDMFKEAGLDPENPPKTWEDLKAAAKKLTVYDGDMVARSGLQLLTQGYALQFYSLYYQNGGKWEDENHNPVWNNEEFRETMEYLRSLYKEDKVSSDLTASQFQQQHPFLTGAAAISMIDPINAKAFINMDPANKDKIGFLELERKQGGTHAGIQFLYIGANSKNEQAAWDFIEYVMDTDEMWNRYKKTGCPTVRTSLQEKFIEDDPLVNEAVQYGIEVGQGLPKNDWFITFGDKYLIQTMLQELFYTDKPVDQIVEESWSEFSKEFGF